MSWAAFLEVFTVGSLTVSVAFGLVFGATYGWRAGGGAVTLAILGVGSTVLLAFASDLRGPVVWERVAARALLWLLLCAALPIGRRIRLWLEVKRALWRIRHRRGTP